MNFDMIAYILLEFSKNFLLSPHLKKGCHTLWMKPISKNFLLFSLSSNLGKRKSQMPFNQNLRTEYTFYLNVFRFRGRELYTDTADGIDCPRHVLAHRLTMLENEEVQTRARNLAVGPLVLRSTIRKEQASARYTSRPSQCGSTHNS